MVPALQFSVSVASMLMVFWVFFGAQHTEETSDNSTPDRSGAAALSYLLFVPFIALGAMVVGMWKLAEFLWKGASDLWESSEDHRHHVRDAMQQTATTIKHNRLLRIGIGKQTSDPTGNKHSPRHAPVGDDNKEGAAFDDEEEELLSSAHKRRDIRPTYWQRQKIWFNTQLEKDPCMEEEKSSSKYSLPEEDLPSLIQHTTSSSLPPSIEQIAMRTIEEREAPPRTRESRRVRLHAGPADHEESLVRLRPIGWHMRQRMRAI